MSCRLYVAMSCGLYVALRARVNRRGSTQPVGEGLAARRVGAAGSTGGAEVTGTRIGDTGKGQATAGKRRYHAGRSRGRRSNMNIVVFRGTMTGTQIRGQQGLVSKRKCSRAHRSRQMRALIATRRAARARENRRWSTSSRSRNRELRWGEPHGSDKLLNGEVTP